MTFSITSSLDYTINTEPSNGYAKITSDEIFTYIPKTNFIGSDTFSISLTTQNSNKLITTVTILIKDYPDSFSDFKICKN